MAIRIVEKGWIHNTLAKASINPSTWEIVPPEDLLKVKIKKKIFIADSGWDKSL